MFSMSDKFRGSSIVRLIRLLLIKHGFAEHEADAVIDKLRSELTPITTKELSEEIYSTFSQRLAHYITILQLGDKVSPDELERRCKHNYFIIIGVISAGIFEVLSKGARS
jgi:hypothetical protein